ncbi:MAG: InlB B-repeat-containing protein [Oscillospiraceae bacterium]|nr:InlB B-repeat-containing protein [Oscillospiraceae bacterium]
MKNETIIETQHKMDSGGSRGGKKSIIVISAVLLVLCVAAFVYLINKPEKIVPYKVVFDLNAGTLISGETEQSVMPGKESKPPEIERPGYEFEGWKADSRRCGSDCRHIYSDVTFSAAWDRQYRIEFDPVAGNIEHGCALQMIREGKDASAPYVTRDGYIFDGWDADYTRVSCDMSVKAKWKKLYIVTFNVGHALVISGQETQIVAEGDAAIAPLIQDFINTMRGWDADFSDVRSDMTVTALWSQRKADGTVIEFDPAGGELVLGSLKQTIREDMIPVPPQLKRSGYLFTGWDSSVYESEGKRVFIASWKINDFSSTVHTVIFDACGGSMTGDGIQYISDGQSAEAPAVKRDGYRFLMWSCDFENVTDDLYIRATWTRDEKINIDSIRDKLTAATVVMHMRTYSDGAFIMSEAAGFFITSDGVAVTAAHVVDDKTHIYAEDINGKKYYLSGIIVSDRAHDTAIIKFEAENVPFLPLSSAAPMPGDNIFTMGHPGARNYVLTSGTVIDPDYNSGNVIGGIINGYPGNSGGPIVNEKCEIVGVFSGVIHTNDGRVLSNLSNAQFIKTIDHDRIIERVNCFEFSGRYKADIYEAVRPEREKNGSIALAQAMRSGVTVSGEITSWKDVDVYKIKIPTNKPTCLTAAVVYRGSGTPNRIKALVLNEGVQALSDGKTYTDSEGRIYTEFFIYTERAQTLYIAVVPSGSFDSTKTEDHAEYDVFTDISPVND